MKTVGWRCVKPPPSTPPFHRKPTCSWSEPAAAGRSGRRWQLGTTEPRSRTYGLGRGPLEGWPTAEECVRCVCVCVCERESKCESVRERMCVCARMHEDTHADEKHMHTEEHRSMPSLEREAARTCAGQATGLKAWDWTLPVPVPPYAAPAAPAAATAPAAAAVVVASRPDELVPAAAAPRPAELAPAVAAAAPAELAPAAAAASFLGMPWRWPQSH